MEITEIKRNGAVILGLAGRLDASNAGVLEEKLLTLIAGGNTRLVIDGNKLDYISSAGLRVLLVAAKRLNATGGKISLYALKDQIKEVFDIAGFSSIFAIYRTQDEAIASVR
jgi:anti-sigma B factor antagonist